MANTRRVFLISSFLLILIINVPLCIPTSRKEYVARNTNVGSEIGGKGNPLTSESLMWAANGVPICSHYSGTSASQLISDGAGGAIIIWGDYRSGNRNIYAQRIDSTGVAQWPTNGVVICYAANDQDFPQIVGDGTGGAIITWQDPRGAAKDIYAQRVSSSGVTQWTANGVAICTASNNQENPQITSDGAGGAIITWQDYRSGSDYSTYVQRVNSAGIVQWTANGVYIRGGGNYPTKPQIISDGAGGAIIAMQLGFFVGYDIYAQRVDSSGTGQWGAYGIAICTEDDNQDSPQLTSDGGAGGAIITWEDNRTGNYNIYAQRVSSTGDTLWIGDGVPVCTASYGQVKPQITSDGTGGAIITWADDRNTASTHLDIYAQRINSAGVYQWTYNGVPVCNAGGDQDLPRLISDGAGGAIFTWADQRWMYHDFYVRRLDSTGTIRWGDHVFASDYNTFSAEQAHLVTDGAGGAIIVFPIMNGIGGELISAQRVADLPPAVNHPSDIVTSISGGGTIDWILSDDQGPGTFRVIANGTGGEFYTWVTPTNWTNNVALNVPINHVAAGNFNYTIEYTDDQGVSGPSDTVIVTIGAPGAPSPTDYTLLLMILIALVGVAVICGIIWGSMLLRKGSRILSSLAETRNPPTKAELPERKNTRTKQEPSGKENIQAKQDTLESKATQKQDLKLHNASANRDKK